MNSAIYKGQVWHTRKHPREHKFNYKLFMMFIDLDETDMIFKGTKGLWGNNKKTLAMLKREDYHKPEISSLKEAIYSTVKDELGVELNGPVRMLTNLRYFGIQFNPVTFYYCYDESGETLIYILSEITNTPWFEKHHYIIKCSDSASSKHRTSFDKAFHISPFMDMGYRYDWQFNTPCESLDITMNSYKKDRQEFNATLRLTRKKISPGTLNSMLLLYPFMTLKVIVGIYWQALRLKLKKIPFHSHPKTTGDIKHV